MTDYAAMSPAAVRALIREGKIDFPTTGMCAGYAQGNLVGLPKELAWDFLLFCQRNPKACPLLEVADAGSRTFPLFGAGSDIAKPDGHMVVDIGGGTADIAVISLSGVVESASIKIAGDQLNEAVVKYMRRKHNLLVGERTAEEMKKQIGCVFPKEEEETMDVKGRCLLTGLPKVVTVSSTEMMDAFEEPVERIMEAIHSVLERTPPELVADISTNGIIMTGGGSLVSGFDKLVTARTGIHTVIAEDAISCVALGTGKSLDSLNNMQDGTMNLSRRKQMN